MAQMFIVVQKNRKKHYLWGHTELYEHTQLWSLGANKLPQEASETDFILL